MEKDFKYIIVIPTHRINFLKENLESIINQTIKPDLIIGIDDTDIIAGTTQIKELFDEVSQTIPVRYYNKDSIILKNTRIKNGPMRAFNNIFLCLKDVMSLDTTVNQYGRQEYLVHILEDDCYYIGKTSIEKIIIQHKKFNAGLYRLNLVENQNDVQNSLKNVINKNSDKLRTKISYDQELVDTSGFIFKCNREINTRIINYLEDKQYTLSADVYIFEILFNYHLKKFVDLNSILIFSTQHPAQVSRKYDNDLYDDSHKWLYDLKRFGIDISERNLYQEFINSLIEIKERRENNPISKEEYLNIPSVKFAMENNIELGIFGI